MIVSGKRRPRRRIGKVLLILFSVLTIGALAGGTANYMRPLPAITYTTTGALNLPEQPTNIAWPAYGQAAVATAEQGVLGTNGAQTPLATASIAKVIVSLCVLEKYPLNPGQTGPNVTITPADVAIYNNYIANDGSVVAVQTGEQLTEYQLLEGIMLPSGNNLADTAAIWAYGSLANYATYANKYLAMHGLTQIHVGTDASGLDPSTAGNASDLARLGLLALEEPVLVEIMGKTQTSLPVAGTVRNYNSLLGTNGIIGIKTGNNDQNLGAFLFAAKLPVGDKTVTATGTVMGAGSLSEALNSTATLVGSLPANFSTITAVSKGQALGIYKTAWGTTAKAVATKEVSITHWKGDTLTTKTSLSATSPSNTTAEVGHTRVYSGLSNTDTPLRLSSPLYGPSFWWRLTRH